MELLKSSTITLSCLCFLSACVNMQPYPEKPDERWFKAGTSYEDTRSKLAKCKYDIGMNKVSPTEKYSLIVSCMVADGYRWGIPPEELNKWEEKVKTMKSQGIKYNSAPMGLFYFLN